MIEPESLQGRQILVVEDDYFIGFDFAATLEELGATVFGPVGNIDDALDLLADGADIDGAVLDLNLGGELSYPIADVLAKRGIPFVFTTGYDRFNVLSRYSDVPRCEKPVQISDVVQALAR